MIGALLFDRDGTLIVDVPYNGDPGRVQLAPTVLSAIELLRAHHVPFAVVSNQSGLACGLLTTAQVDAVNARLSQLLGEPRLAFFMCPHARGAGCACRKPEPGLLRAAADYLAVPVEACGVVGDTGADVDAGRNAGARAVLVPTPATSTDEIEAAPATAASVLDAVRLLLDEVHA
ncbi:MAG: hypothetical protein JWM93_304 [Frankiales bacterium]|nr:hypothetical protein [Frankiales bacterium]